jgi:hypothetical protein
MIVDKGTGKWDKAGFITNGEKCVFMHSYLSVFSCRGCKRFSSFFIHFYNLIKRIGLLNMHVMLNLIIITL